MKKLFLIIGVAVLALAAVNTVSAQQAYGSTTVISSQTYAAGTTNLATPQAFFVGNRQNVSIQMTTAAAAPGATNVFYFSPSVDGVSYDTNSASQFSTTNVVVGAGTVTKVQNINTVGHGFIALTSVTQGNATSTNTVKQSVKVGAP